jgi:hypothetical protein
MLGFKSFQLSLKTIMMVVLTAAAASALYAKVYLHTGALAGWGTDVPSLFLLAIVLTSFALGNWKEHSLVQIMLQITISCLVYLVLIQISEAQFDRAMRYWFQGSFALLVCLPLLARRYVKSRMPRGPRRNWWKKTCEAVFFSFLTIILVSAGGLFQWALYMLLSEFLKIPPVPF